MGSSDGPRFGARFKLTLLTSDPALAAAADAAGVDRIGLDIERIGKAERQQAHPTARISPHQLADLAILRGHVRKAGLFCRLDGPHPGSRAQVERALDLGADSLMLPFFREIDEAAAFADAVAGRAEVILLVETVSAAWRIQQLAEIDGVDEIMVGLNDLAWDSGAASRFELLTSPLLAALGEAARAAGKRFTVGGLGRWDDDRLPTSPDLIYAQYPRLAAEGAWIARSFLDGVAPDGLGDAVDRLRARLDHWAAAGPPAWEDARRALSAHARAAGDQGH